MNATIRKAMEIRKAIGAAILKAMGPEEFANACKLAIERLQAEIKMLEGVAAGPPDAAAVTAAQQAFWKEQEGKPGISLWGIIDRLGDPTRPNMDSLAAEAPPAADATPPADEPGAALEMSVAAEVAKATSARELTKVHADLTAAIAKAIQSGDAVAFGAVTKAADGGQTLTDALATAAAACEKRVTWPSELTKRR